MSHLSLACSTITGMVAVRVGVRRDREGVTPGGYRPLFSAQEQSEGPLADGRRMSGNLPVIPRSGKPGAHAVGGEYRAAGRARRMPVGSYRMDRPRPPSWRSLDHPAWWSAARPTIPAVGLNARAPPASAECLKMPKGHLRRKGAEENNYVLSLCDGAYYGCGLMRESAVYAS